MQTVTLVGSLVVVAITLLNSPQPATGQCCTNAVQFIKNLMPTLTWVGVGVEYKGDVCNDCTRPTPYCGYGKCNLFGCNCDGGCREGRCQRRKRSVGGLDVPVIKKYANASTIVAAGDLNGDGALSVKEAQGLLKSIGVNATRRALLDMDKNGDGKLSPKEIDPPKVKHVS